MERSGELQVCPHILPELSPESTCEPAVSITNYTPWNPMFADHLLEDEVSTDLSSSWFLSRQEICHFTKPIYHHQDTCVT